MSSGSILSGLFHLALALAIVFGLPSFMKPLPEPEPLSTVEVVTMAPKATAPELTKPPVPKQPDPPKQEVKPEAPQPAPAPPPKAAEVKPDTPKETIPDKKAEVVKPEPKKEEPKKEEPKKVEAKKPEKDRFDSVLDSVLKNRAPVKAAPPDPQPKNVAAAPPQARQTAPNLSDQLARSEMEAVRDKVIPCWSFPAGAPHPEQLIVAIEMQMNQDGTVRDARIVPDSRISSDPFYRAAAEAALRATLNPRCQPFPLPVERYAAWRSLILRFDPRDL